MLGSATIYDPLKTPETTIHTPQNKPFSQASFQSDYDTVIVRWNLPKCNSSLSNHHIWAGGPLVTHRWPFTTPSKHPPHKKPFSQVSFLSRLHIFSIAIALEDFAKSVVRRFEHVVPENRRFKRLQVMADERHWKRLGQDKFVVVFAMDDWLDVGVRHRGHVAFTSALTFFN